MAFRLHNTLGTQNERYFVAVNPTAHSLACLRIGVFVTADAARLATGVGGSPFTGRVSHPLDGEHSFMTSPHRHSPLTSLAWSHHATTPRAVAEGPCALTRWCVARGGGLARCAWRRSPGRVRAPAGRRLCLLCQIGDELVAGVEQFLLVDDVVAIEDGAALVPGQEHGDPLGDVRADEVARGGAAAVVEEAGRHPSGLAGGAPRGAPAPDGDAVAVEDERAVGVAACPPPRQGLGDGRRDGEDAAHQRLRARGREPDDTAGLVNLLPGETKDLLLAPARVVGEVEDVLPRGGQVGADGERYSGCSKKPWRGGFSRRRSGKPGTVSSQPQWTASVPMRWRAEVSRLIVPVAAPAARRASWYWRIWCVVSPAARAARPKKAARWAVRPRAVLTDRNCRTW